jgi:hypothetical protein
VATCWSGCSSELESVSAEAASDEMARPPPRGEASCGTLDKERARNRSLDTAPASSARIRACRTPASRTLTWQRPEEAEARGAGVHHIGARRGREGAGPGAAGAPGGGARLRPHPPTASFDALGAATRLQNRHHHTCQPTITIFFFVSSLSPTLRVYPPLCSLVSVVAGKNHCCHLVVVLLNFTGTF